MHPLQVRNVAQCLYEIFIENRYADKVIEQALRSNPKAGSRDRAFLAETTYEIVRYFRLYTAVLGRQPETLNDFWQIAGIHLFAQGNTLPEWREFLPLQRIDLKTRLQQASKAPAVKESLPDWLYELGEQELEAKWPETLHWLNKPAQVVLRVNRLRSNPAQLLQALDSDHIEADAMPGTDALVLKVRKNVFKTEAFKKGWFEVQDFSSQMVSPLLAPEPGMRVVDACAGGGGKTLHLAALMQNKGSLIALDTLAWKLDELKARARRAGVSNIETRPILNKKTIKRLYGTADRLLLDVPCSGTGVLRRNPDTKWKMQPTQFEQLRATQQEILQDYSRITKPGGRMVYATCSILPSENRKQVDAFLSSEAGRSFRLITDRSILPQDEGFDGFYMALLERAATD